MKSLNMCMLFCLLALTCACSEEDPVSAPPDDDPQTTIDTPEILSPEADALCSVTGIRFEWKAIKNAHRYQLQLGRTELSAFEVLFDTTLTITLCRPALDLAYCGGTFAWRVRSLGSGTEVSDWSDLRKLRFQSVEEEFSNRTLRLQMTALQTVYLTEDRLWHPGDPRIGDPDEDYALYHDLYFEWYGTNGDRFEYLAVNKTVNPWWHEDSVRLTVRFSEDWMRITHADMSIHEQGRYYHTGSGGGRYNDGYRRDLDLRLTELEHGPQPFAWTAEGERSIDHILSYSDSARFSGSATVPSGHGGFSTYTTEDLLIQLQSYSATAETHITLSWN